MNPIGEVLPPCTLGFTSERYWYTLNPIIMSISLNLAISHVQ